MADPWNMESVSNAVPTTTPNDASAKPQDHGWADKTAYDYETYTKSSKELAQEKEERAATNAVADHYQDSVGGIPVGEWHNNAAVYEWDDEYGDVGPEFPELERQLFGSEFHVKSGIDFQKLSTIKVVQEGV
ncbi:hypothetical protein Golomagni_02646 [Golovinomyces magnicellulatus]|nr:hypothetical protein Golomagni_02646 [Golovinomyces magnicellulatus]